jgi:hypothetical protein
MGVEGNGGLFQNTKIKKEKGIKKTTPVFVGAVVVLLSGPTVSVHCRWKERVAIF